jgi:hypothetical protein
MVQQDHSQSNPGVIETLKAATRQVGQPSPRDEHFGSPTVESPVAHTARGEPERKLQSMPVASANSAEAFVRKITAVEQEKAKIEQEQLVVEQELARVKKLQLGLTEKKQQLEQRRNGLVRVKDKLSALDKEINEILQFSSL